MSWDINAHPCTSPMALPKTARTQHHPRARGCHSEMETIIELERLGKYITKRINVTADEKITV